MLRAEGERRRAAGGFARAGIGRSSERRTYDAIRSDDVLWLDEQAAQAAEAPYWAGMQVLRQALNRELFLGLRSSEFHYAHYPVGGFYKRHLDRFQDSDSRVLSCVLYLNEGWQETDGGQLRIWTGEDAWLDVVPCGGRLVTFLSGQFWHEVQAAQRERWSLTGWMRRD